MGRGYGWEGVGEVVSYDIREGSWSILVLFYISCSSLFSIRL